MSTNFILRILEKYPENISICNILKNMNIDDTYFAPQRELCFLINNELLKSLKYLDKYLDKCFKLSKEISIRDNVYRILAVKSPLLLIPYTHSDLCKGRGYNYKLNTLLFNTDETDEFKKNMQRIEQILLDQSVRDKNIITLFQYTQDEIDNLDKVELNELKRTIKKTNENNRIIKGNTLSLGILGNIQNLNSKCNCNKPNNIQYKFKLVDIHNNPIEYNSIEDFCNIICRKGTEIIATFTVMMHTPLEKYTNKFWYYLRLEKIKIIKLPEIETNFDN
jgi:hypothetical protein